jgi:hypothetical protein
MSDTLYYVRDTRGNLVPARVLTDDNGTPIQNPNYGRPFSSSTGSVEFGSDRLRLLDRNGVAVDQHDLQYLLVPANFNLRDFIANAIESSNDFFDNSAFWTHERDLQRNQEAIRPDGATTQSGFVLAFTDANSVLLGMAESMSAHSGAGLAADAYNTLFGQQSNERNQRDRSVGEDIVGGDNFSGLKRHLSETVDHNLLNSSPIRTMIAVSRRAR